MSEDPRKRRISEVGAQHVDAIRDSNRRLIERALLMRAESYLADVKAKLLTRTIFEIDSSKKVLGETNRRLSESLATITTQRDELEQEISARKEAEAALRQAQKMEALGQMTGGVAHDFNNMLTAITGNLELLGDSMQPGSKEAGLQKNALHVVERGAELVQRLLAFSRKQPLRPVATDVNRLITGMSGMLRRIVPQDFAFEMKLDPDLKSAVIDAAQLESALLNIVNNSRRAMPNGGGITIRTANAVIAKPSGQAVDLPAGNYVQISVLDAGEGMSDEVLEKAFEPFFTTRGFGEGSGLGLSMVHGFANQSGGKVWIESEVNEGTAVELLLPASDNPVEHTRHEEKERTPPSGSGEKILVVEDDPDIREYVSTVLSGLGYTVVTAEDGPSALGLLPEIGPIDLLFCDIVMPGGMNGRQVAASVREHQPGVRVLFTSGYTDLEPGGDTEDAELLSKPYTRQELAERIHSKINS